MEKTKSSIRRVRKPSIQRVLALQKVRHENDSIERGSQLSNIHVISLRPLTYIFNQKLNRADTHQVSTLQSLVRRTKYVIDIDNRSRGIRDITRDIYMLISTSPRIIRIRDPTGKRRNDLDGRRKNIQVFNPATSSHFPFGS